MRKSKGTEDLLLKPADVARILRVGIGVCYNGLRRSLPWIRVGRLLRMRRSSLDAWIARREQQSARTRRRPDRDREHRKAA